MKKKFDKLHTYLWVGKNKRGARVNGEMNAVNPSIIEAELRRQDIVIIKIKKNPNHCFPMRKKLKR